MLLELCTEYEQLRRDRDAVAAIHADMAVNYHKCNGEIIDSFFKPQGLPPADKLPPIEQIYDASLRADPESNFTKPAQRQLTQVVLQRRWLECLSLAKQCDGDPATAHHSTRYREAARWVAVGQEGSGAWLDIFPDGSYAMRIESTYFITALQRRGGLYLSRATGVLDTLEAEGETVDRIGDRLQNSGEYNRRHNALLQSIYKMLSAVAIGSVVLGDKEDKEKTAMFNADHAVDLVECGGADDGGDVNLEVKCPSATTSSRSEGNGSVAGGGAPASVGHLYAFGNTRRGTSGSRLGCASAGGSGTGRSDTPRGVAGSSVTRATTTTRSTSRRLRPT